jgi:hypothetical protein
MISWHQLLSWEEHILFEDEKVQISYFLRLVHIYLQIKTHFHTNIF